jgi:hypothetical protein
VRKGEEDIPVMMTTFPARPLRTSGSTWIAAMILERIMVGDGKDLSGANLADNTLEYQCVAFKDRPYRYSGNVGSG